MDVPGCPWTCRASLSRRASRAGAARQERRRSGGAVGLASHPGISQGAISAGTLLLTIQERADSSVRSTGTAMAPVAAARAPPPLAPAHGWEGAALPCGSVQRRLGRPPSFERGQTQLPGQAWRLLGRDVGDDETNAAGEHCSEQEMPRAAAAASAARAAASCAVRSMPTGVALLPASWQ